MADSRRWFVMILAVAFAVPAWAGSGNQLFDSQCASCHTLGGGDSGGPDLKGIGAQRPLDWLIRVIAEPDKLSAEKDPVQLALVKKYGYEMPNLGISREDAHALALFLTNGAAAPGSAGPPGEQPGKKAELAVTPELISQGVALFTGARPFAKGGAPCSACHALTYPGVAGGNLATDLSSIYEGMGEQGMKGAFKSLKFPIMKKIYADRPLTDEEITALIVFSRAASERKNETGFPLFPAAGAGLFLICIAGLTLYKRRIG